MIMIKSSLMLFRQQLTQQFYIVAVVCTFKNLGRDCCMEIHKGAWYRFDYNPSSMGRWSSFATYYQYKCAADPEHNKWYSSKSTKLAG